MNLRLVGGSRTKKFTSFPNYVKFLSFFVVWKNLIGVFRRRCKRVFRFTLALSIAVLSSKQIHIWLEEDLRPITYYVGTAILNNIAIILWSKKWYSLAHWSSQRLKLTPVTHAGGVGVSTFTDGSGAPLASPRTSDYHAQREHSTSDLYFMKESFIKPLGWSAAYNHRLFLFFSAVSLNLAYKALQ